MADIQQFLAIEIGGTKLQLAVGLGDGQILGRRRLQVAVEKGAEGIRQQIAREISDLQKNTPIQAIGVGFGGPTNWRTGQIACSHQIPGWSEFPLAEWLRGLSGVPVRVDNDANTAALGEALCGAGQGYNPVFYTTLGSGVGGGLVLHGQIYHGAVPGESEIGHVRLNREGLIVEQSCSGWAVDRKIREAAAKHPNSFLAQLTRDLPPGGEARFLNQALQAKDSIAAEIFSQTCADLAFALSHVVHLMHPEILVLGGGLSLLGEPLRLELERILPGQIMTSFAPGPIIALAALREDSVPAGALKLAQMALSGAS